MRLPFCLSCPMLLFILLGISAEIRFNVNAFVDLILDIRKFYSAVSVIFVHPGDMYGDYDDLQITHLVHTSSRLLSKRYILTANVHYKKLWRTLRYHHKIIRPITVVILPDFEAYLEFVNAVKTYSMSFPVWFILFLYTPDNSTHDYCRKPIGNPFNLTFNTQMLVLCNNEIILREWYSVKGDTVKIFDLAEWKDDKGFIPLTNLSLYERRKDMEGVVLRAVEVLNKIQCAIFYSLGSTIGKNQVATVYQNVLEEITSSLNFTLKIVSRKLEHGMRNRQTLIWSGVMGEIVYHRADFAIADMSLTSFRTQYVDFTQPLIVSKINLYIKESGICSVNWISYFQTFNSSTWATIIILIAIAPLILFFMKMYYNQSRSTVDLISENYICIWGIFCQQGLIEFPKRSSLRVAYFTIFLTAVLIMAHYSAALICFLTTCARVLPFQTLEEFIDDGTYKLIMLYESGDYDVVTFQAQYEKKLFYIKLMKLMKNESELPRTIREGFIQVCNESNVVFMTSARKKDVEKEIPCKVSTITTERIENLAMVLSKNNPYTNVINYHLQKFLDSGMVRRLKEMYSSQFAKNKIYNPVYLFNVIPILTILCGGFIISIIVLIIEKIHYRSRRKKFQSRESLILPENYLFKKYNN